MKRYLPSEKSKIHQDFQHLFKADLILLTKTPTLALHSRVSPHVPVALVVDQLVLH